MVLNPNDQLPGGPGTVNEEFFDALVRHQIGLLRLTGSIRNRIYRILDATEADIADQIQRRLDLAEGLVRPADVRRLNTLLETIRRTRLRAWNQVDEVWLTELRDLARQEPEFVSGMLKTVSPVVVDTIIPPVSTLNAIVTTRPFEGRILRDWARDIRRADLQRIEDQIRIGLVQGEGSQQIARRVVGTARRRGTDGITQTTRRNAEAITRTAVISISNQARREFFTANSDLFSEELYVATLDARTTPICRSLDGQTFPIGEGPIPPLHFSCRSLRTAVIAPEPLGRRPAKPFTERQLLSDFTSQQGIDRVIRRADLPRGFKGRYDAFARARIRELTGTVPAKVTYEQWLGRQTMQFQNEILGVARARLFRRGNLSLARFVNRQGDELPLSQLARQHRSAFIAAGLDPQDFI